MRHDRTTRHDEGQERARRRDHRGRQPPDAAPTARLPTYRARASEATQLRARRKAEREGPVAFHLVRLTCTFLPRKDDVTVEWARFAVRLHPDAAARQPLVFDLYPQEVTKSVDRDVRVTVNPMIKFAQVAEASTGGGIAFGYRYSDLQPLVTGVVVDEGTTAVWDYRDAKGSAVRGWKKMYLLAKVPKEMASGDASLTVVADVSVRGAFRIPAIFGRRKELDVPSVIARLWG